MDILKNPMLLRVPHRLLGCSDCGPALWLSVAALCCNLSSLHSSTRDVLILFFDFKAGGKLYTSIVLRFAVNLFRELLTPLSRNHADLLDARCSGGATVWRVSARMASSRAQRRRESCGDKYA